MRRNIYFVFFYGAGVESNAPLILLFIGLLYQTWMTEGVNCGVIGGMNEWQGNPKYSENTSTTAALSITVPT
jgi:hypothetical protein